MFPRYVSSLGELRKFSVRLNSLAEPQEKEPMVAGFVLYLALFVAVGDW